MRCILNVTNTNFHVNINLYEINDGNFRTNLSILFWACDGLSYSSSSNTSISADPVMSTSSLDEKVPTSFCLPVLWGAKLC